MDTGEGDGVLVTWRDEVIGRALQWEGTPFTHGARVLGVAVDCANFAFAVYDPLCHMPLPPKVPLDWFAHSDKEVILDFIDPFFVRVEKPQKGSLVIAHGGLVYCHMAIDMGDGECMHAWNDRVKRVRFEVLSRSAQKTEWPLLYFDPVI